MGYIFCLASPLIDTSVIINNHPPLLHVAIHPSSRVPSIPPHECSRRCSAAAMWADNGFPFIGHDPVGIWEPVCQCPTASNSAAPTSKGKGLVGT